MDRYKERINLHGKTQRERYVARVKDEVERKAIDNPSCKEVLLNGVDTNLVITRGTQPYYKTFTSMPNQEVNAGDYVEFAKETWLVYSADSDDEVYIYGDLRQCNHTMYWQSEDGKIVSRKVWVQNASAYNNGVEGNQNIELQSNQFMIFMPYDDASACLGENVGCRFNMTRDINRCSTYELTRFDDINYAYGKKGMLNLILTQDQFNSDTDKLVALDDGSEVWICDYHSPAVPQEPIPDESQILSAKISGGDTLRYGQDKTWTVVFYNNEGNEVDCDFTWNISGKYSIEHTIDKNTIQLRTENEDCLNSSFLLQVINNNDNSVIAEIEITVVGLF